MEIRFVDSVTGKIYEFSVVDEKLTMTEVDDDGTNVYTSYLLLDEVTGKVYMLEVTNSELTMVVSGDIASDTIILLGDYVLEVVGGKLMMRDATDADKALQDIMERKLLDYLPIFVQEYAEIQAIMDAEQISVDETWGSVENVMNDQFVSTSTQNGVKRWESILGITPKGTYTLDERKFNILARLNEQLPYTMETLKNSLETLCGANGYTLKLDADKYEITIKLALSNANNFEAVEQLLAKTLPANIFAVVVLFNNHIMLSAYTHEQLAAYTHKGVREEII